MTFLWILLLSLVVIYLSVYLIKVQNKFRPLSKFISVKLAIPEYFKFVKNLFFGSEYILTKYTNKKVLLSLYDRYKKHDNFVVWTFGYPILLSGKHEHVELIARNCAQKSFFLDLGKPYFREGLIISKEEKWKKARKIIEPSFSTKILSGFVPIMQHHSELLAKKLGNTLNEWIEIDDLITRAAFNITLETSMGVSTETDTEDNEIEMFLHTIKMGTDLMIQRAMNPILWPKLCVNIYLRFFCKISLNPDFMENLFRKIILKAIERQKMNNEPKSVSNDLQIRKKEIFVDHLARIHVDGLNNNKELMTLPEIEDEVNNFVFAGFESIQSGVFWTLAFIGNDQSIQDKMYQEISEVLESESVFDLENVNRLVYVEQCIKEGLRMMPPIAFYTRHANHEFTLDGKLIPKGTQILALIWNIHRDAKIYPDPETYNPDRFSPDRCDDIPSTAFLPFGSAPRICIGNRFALIEMKILLATIVKNFRVICEKPAQDIDFYMKITLKPLEQVKFKFIARNTNGC